MRRRAFPERDRGKVGGGLWVILALWLLTSTANAQATSIPADNFSFESVGASPGGAWNSLPDSGAWTNPAPASLHQILDLAVDPTHFPSYNEAPGGGRILYLGDWGQPLRMDFTCGD